MQARELTDQDYNACCDLRTRLGDWPIDVIGTEMNLKYSSVCKVIIREQHGFVLSQHIVHAAMACDHNTK